MMRVMQAKDNLRQKIKDEYVTIANFAKKKGLKYESFRIWLHADCKTKDMRKIRALGEFDKEIQKTLINMDMEV